MRPGGGIRVAARQGVVISSHVALVITVAVTTVCWVATAYLGPATDPAVLRAFYRKVRPAGAGWAPVRAQLGPGEDAGTGESLPLALVGWALGCTMVWSALFAIGQALSGAIGTAMLLAVTASLSAIGVAAIARRLWPAEPHIAGAGGGVRP